MIRYVLTIILLGLIYFIGRVILINSPSNRAAPKNKPISLAYLIDYGEVRQRIKEDVYMLAGKIGSRNLFYPHKLKEAKDFVKARLEKFGVVKEYPYTMDGAEVANLELDIFANSIDNGIIIIGAHYDTVPTTPGADDNASAVAALLELARQADRLKEAKQLKKNIRFVAFTLEEPPAFNTRDMGSRRYVAALKQRGEKIIGMICLEMVGFTSNVPGSQEIPFPLNLRNYPRTGDFVAFVANLASASFLKLLISCAEYENTLFYERLVVPGKGRIIPISRLSDHAGFWDKGYPAVMVTDTAFLRNPNYHGSEDKPQTLDYEFMTKLVQTLLLLF